MGPTLDHQEQFVLGLVMMPNELALKLDELHVRVIHLPDDLRAPMIRELPELLLEVHFRQHSIPPRKRSPRACVRPGDASATVVSRYSRCVHAALVYFSMSECASCNSSSVHVPPTT